MNYLAAHCIFFGLLIFYLFLLLFIFVEHMQSLNKTLRQLLKQIWGKTNKAFVDFIYKGNVHV